jgi:hypothetical protein
MLHIVFGISKCCANYLAHKCDILRFCWNCNSWWFISNQILPLHLRDQLLKSRQTYQWCGVWFVLLPLNWYMGSFGLLVPENVTWSESLFKWAFFPPIVIMWMWVIENQVGVCSTSQINVMFLSKYMCVGKWTEIGKFMVHECDSWKCGKFFMLFLQILPRVGRNGCWRLG